MNLNITALFALLMFTFGCPSGTEEHEHEHEHESEAIPESILSSKASGEAYTLKIITADPDPATKGKNNWTVTLTDSNDTPVSGAAITVVPFMTIHGHGTSPSSFTAIPSDQVGEYFFTELNFIMAGTWQMTFTVSLNENADAGINTDEIIMSVSVAN